MHLFTVVHFNVHCKRIPVMKTGFSLFTFSHRDKPVPISWDPCNENRFFPVGKKYTGKSLFWPCTDPVRDCSEGILIDVWIMLENWMSHFWATALILFFCYSLLRFRLPQRILILHINSEALPINYSVCCDFFVELADKLYNPYYYFAPGERLSFS